MSHDRFERATLLAWPAAVRETRFGWEFCASDGYSGRVNSIWPLAWTGETNLDLAFATAIVWCGQNGIDPCFRLTEGLYAPSKILSVLRAAKYTPHDESWVMTRPLPGRAATRGPLSDNASGDVDPGSTSASRTWPASVELLEAPDDTIWSPLRAAAPSPGDFNERRNIVQRIATPHVFARASLDGKPAAIGLGVLTGDLFGIYLMRTAPVARRRGLARAIVRALLHWGANNGATESYLQVEKSTPGAIALYESEGFVARYGYAYWRLKDA